MVQARYVFAMKKINCRGVDLWVGTVPKLGTVIFDPRSQIGVGAGRVRLFVQKKGKMTSFAKDVVRARLRGRADRDRRLRFEKAVRHYLGLRRRTTHCFRCKQDLNSVDFDTCDNCGWIRCACGACGCRFRRHTRRSGRRT